MTEGKRVTQASDVPGLDLTPVFANRFNIAINAMFTRIAFGEFVGGDPDTDTRFHTALVVPTADVVAFAELILNLHARTVQASQTLGGVSAPSTDRAHGK